MVMKRYFTLAMTLCVILFCGCSKDDDGGSLVIDGVNVVGTWAQIGDIWDVKDDPNEILTMWQEGGKIEDLIIVTANKTLRSYSPTEQWYEKWYEGDYPWECGFVFSNGYLQDCSMSDFEEDGEVKFSVENGRVYASGVHLDLRFERNDIVTWYDDGDPTQRYKRVKGFK